MLELQKVTKSYGSARAVDGLDLVIEAGRTTVLIGPSGCGKTTILRLMVGLLLPDQGKVSFCGAVIESSNVEDIRRRLGYVIQDGGLFPHMTARENVTLMARHLRRDLVRSANLPRGKLAGAGRRGDREFMTERTAELARLVQLPEMLLDRYPVELSGGQQQRVSLMRALMLDPDVLLLDEPLGALDPMIRADLQGDLRRIFRELGKTVVMVTHDLGEAGYLGDTIVLLKDGAIVQQGTLKDLVETPADPFVTRFINAQRSPLETTSE